MNRFYLTEINIYPIKSLGGISLQEALVEERGLQYDRRWMLIDEDNVFITQRTYHELALLQVSMIGDQVSITHKLDPQQQISFPVTAQIGEPKTVTVWDDVTSGVEVDKEVSSWFSNFLKMKVKLVKMPSNENRLVETKYASNNEVVSFADGYPNLIIGEASLNGLNEKLTDPVLMDRFRPNFVFSGGEPHIEDSFSTFQISDTLFTAVKPCARCVLTTVDQQTGIKGQEPLRTLAGYRTIDKKVMFGQNLIHEGAGMVRIGDELKIKSWK
ncbi:MAG: MOSC N-terminal beta barrel domain-containing protein [Bacteroidota bacterium]